MDLFALCEQSRIVYHLPDLVKAANPQGLFMEFGVSSGSTLFQIAINTQATVYGFDCWEGLPEDLVGYKDGVPFIQDGKGSFRNKPGPLPTNCVLVDGYFENTVPPFWEQHR